MFKSFLLAMLLASYTPELTTESGNVVVKRAGSTKVTVAASSVNIHVPLIQAGVYSNTPTEPFACGADTRGAMIVADDTDDVGGSVLCFCGFTGASAYDWLLSTSTAAGGGEVACPFF